MYASWTSCHRCGWYKKAQKTHQLPQDLVNSHMMNNYGKMVEAILAIRFFGLPFFWHFRLCSQHFTVKLWLPQMLPNFVYGCQVMPTDVKKRGLPQMSANRPNIGSTGMFAVFAEAFPPLWDRIRPDWAPTLAVRVGNDHVPQNVLTWSKRVFNGDLLAV
jgi:hypothetical protein